MRALRLRRTLVIVFVALATLAGAGCHHGGDEPGPGDGASLTFTPKATITLTDDRIDPASVDLRVGDAITVVNQGARDHGLTSDSIDTGTLRPGESTLVYLTATGTIDAYDRDATAHHVTIHVAAKLT